MLKELIYSGIEKWIHPIVSYMAKKITVIWIITALLLDYYWNPYEINIFVLDVTKYDFKKVYHYYSDKRLQRILKLGKGLIFKIVWQK